MQRIFQHARQPARFLFGESTGNDGVATINRIANHRRRLDDAVQNNREAITFKFFGDLAESFRAFAVELQLHRPAFLAKIGVRARDVFTAEVGLLFHKQAFDSRLFVSFRAHRIGFDAVLRRDDVFALVDPGQFVAVVGIDETELELGHTRKLVARLLNRRGIEPRNLDEDTIVADRADDRLPTAEIIDPFADHLHRLLLHSLGYFLFAFHHPNEKGGAALDIETERDLFFGRPDCGDAHGDKRHHQRPGDQPFARSEIGREIPTEQNEQAEAKEKCQDGTHAAGFRISDFGFRIFTSLSPPTTSARY